MPETSLDVNSDRKTERESGTESRGGGREGEREGEKGREQNGTGIVFCWRARVFVTSLYLEDSNSVYVVYRFCLIYKVC
ncbi:UNVERIFIED_CONTAM: hypothetical protein FKN15_013238 [Acipenser sinensis]